VTFEEMEKEDAERITANLKILWTLVRGMDASDSKWNAETALRDIEELISSRVLNNY
jgi:hypothetical protein